jgi:hypothetical protein
MRKNVEKVAVKNRSESKKSEKKVKKGKKSA